MRIQSIVEDRMLLVRFLESELKQKAIYSGAPLFQYQVGDLIILRDGDLEENDLSPHLLRRMESACLVESAYHPSPKDIVINLPLILPPTSVMQILPVMRTLSAPSTPAEA